MSDRWRWRCPDCGSVSLKFRVRRGGYRCANCGTIADSSEIIDAVHGVPVSEVDDR